MRGLVSPDRLFKLFHERHAVQRKLASATFELWQRFGFHVVGDHFYDPIPNTQVIKAQYTAATRTLPGLSPNWRSFEGLVVERCAQYLTEYLRFRKVYGYVEENPYFNGFDALYYYAHLRESKPRRVVELGQGFSTRIALSALERNANEGQENPELLSIDAYPRLDLAPVRSVQFRTLTAPIQEIATFLHDHLEDGDLLFVDSSHVFKYGSDVQVLFERVYPQLKSGVCVHIHDVFTPFDYPYEWMYGRKQFWNEQYFLEAFLAFNAAYDVEVPLHYVVRTAALPAVLSGIRRHGSSFYIRRRKDC